VVCLWPSRARGKAEAEAAAAVASRDEAPYWWLDSGLLDSTTNSSQLKRHGGRALLLIIPRAASSSCRPLRLLVTSPMACGWLHPVPAGAATVAALWPCFLSPVRQSFTKEVLASIYIYLFRGWAIRRTGCRWCLVRAAAIVIRFFYSRVRVDGVELWHRLVELRKV
jgi:hypothetical protein